ncbi:unnamed protein product [Allacma fusca]|uniref:Uncharacterized protein n=1 Tax=Allacma fusca TaxID=39272 RepID=A0A8J2K077_9HEXA|nr:unnamed protein product [Allacma fusca]
MVINVNYVTETLMNLIRPIWGDLFNIAEIYGTNKAVWIPRLLKHFPRESLPEWYGGNRKDYKPVQIRG